MSKKHKKHHKSDKPPPEDKPGLKLVLKVGATDQGGESTPPPEEHDGDRKHRHKKKKKKHKHHRDDEERKEKKKSSSKLEEMPVSDIDEDLVEPPPKRQALPAEPADLAGTSGAARNLRERKVVEDETTPLQKCLDFFHKTLVRKDVNGFFAYPVTDNIAPSYSKIIQHPMDLSTMAEKIESNDYSSLLEFKADFKLMCDNCMKYNHPETIYYKEAEKMLKGGMRAMSKDKLLQMKRNIPFMSVVSDQDLGLDQELAPDGSVVAAGTVSRMFSPRPKVKKPAMTKFEAFPDRLTPEQILAQAQDAAKDASDTLTLRKPNTKFGFLRRREDGSTTLNFLNPENDGIVSEKERVVDLGTLVGKVQGGTGVLSGFKEDKRNKAVPVNYLNYGPYSTYAPVYDSSQCNLSKEESDLLLSTYGDDAGIQYTYSIRHFVENCGDYALRLVDNLLDIITNKEHSKAVQILEKVADTQRETPEEVQAEVQAEVKAEESVSIKVEDVTSEDGAGEDDSKENIDFDSLRTLSDIGIDTSFVDSFEERLKQENEVQERLDTTSRLLRDLEQSQHQRLSQSLPAHLAHVSQPDDQEHALAGKVTDELTNLVKQAGPGHVVADHAVRGALGITLEPHESDTTEPVPEVTTVAAADTTTADVHADASDTTPVGDASPSDSQENVMMATLTGVESGGLEFDLAGGMSAGDTDEPMET